MKREYGMPEYLGMVLQAVHFDIQQDLLNWSKFQSIQKIHLKVSNTLFFLCVWLPFLEVQKILLAHSFSSEHIHMSTGNLHMKLEENKIPEKIKVIYLILTSICSGSCARCVCLLYGQFNEEKSVHQKLQFRKLGWGL